jgi:hypothetical protein
MKIKVEKTTIDGVRAFIVKTDSILPNNRHRVLSRPECPVRIKVHGISLRGHWKWWRRSRAAPEH